MKHLFECLTIVAVLFGCSPENQAAIIFTEDFESLTDGNLSGQGGWSGDDIRIGTGSFLNGTRVLDGRIDTGDSQISLSSHGLGGSLSSSAENGLSFFAYMTTNNPVSHVPGIFLDASQYPLLSATAVSVGWSSRSLPAANPPSWVFDARGITGDSGAFVEIQGGFDTPVGLTVAVDGPAGEVYGIYDFGGIPTETQHFTVSASNIELLDRVTILNDYRNPGSYLGGEFDAIRVSGELVVPEPSSLALLGLGSLGLVGIRYRRRRRASSAPPNGDP